jgi:Type IV secretion system proteins
MKKLFISTVSILIISLPIMVKADIFQDIFNEIKQEANLQQLISQYTNQTLQQMMNTAGLDLANKNYDENLQSWGSGAGDWNSALMLYHQASSDETTLAGVENTLNQQFPIQPNRILNNASDQQYYTLKAQTALAARAASQLDYNKINKQIEYMHKLHDMIGDAKTVKDALDLQNRLSVENNLIQLELLRLSALNNQQKAINTQGEVNAVVNNAQAFSSEP